MSKISEFDEYYRILRDQTTNQLGTYLFCCSVSIIWTIYIMFFNSRVVGYIFTSLINFYLKRYYKNVHVKIGSISISILSGKIMFRDLHCVTCDYMCYIQDGWLTFAYWRPPFIKEIKKSTGLLDQSFLTNNNVDEKNKTFIKKSSMYEKKKNARLEIFLTNFQLHYYNSWKPEPDPNATTGSKSEQLNANSNNNIESLNANANGQQEANDFTQDLMKLFSIVNIRINKGKVYAGNPTLLSTLSMRFSSSKIELVTENSKSKVDDRCYIFSGTVNKLEMSFLINNKFKNLNQFKIKHSDLLNHNSSKTKKSENRISFIRSMQCDFEYVQDIPALLTFDRRRVLKTLTGDLVHDDKEPQWSLYVNCVKHTCINYGPWFDKQRECLWKFFFPPTYEYLSPQPSPTLNERRQISKFDFYLDFDDCNTEFNLIFSSAELDVEAPYLERKGTNPDTNRRVPCQDRKLTLKCKSKSSLKCSIPWLTKQYGYQSKITGLFNNVQGYTNNSFKHLICSETFKLNVDINYPLVWNDLQTWNINIDLSRATLHLIFHHKYFFQELINDWSNKDIPDLRTFVPYIYNINLNVNDLELVLPCNQHNWIDTNQLENNALLALLARHATFSIELNFEDFLAEKSNIDFDLKAHEACVRFLIPETNNSLILLKLLKQNIKYISENGIKTEFDSNKWSKFNDFEFYLNDYEKKVSNKHLKENWFECGQTEYVHVTFGYDYYPCQLIDWKNKVYSPTAAYLSQLNPNTNEFDCEILRPDVISVKIELGPCLFLVYATFLKRLWYVKEGYFSWDQAYTEMKNDLQQKHFEDTIPLHKCDKRDARNFRPLSINLSVAIHNIHGHLIMDASRSDPFPIGFTDRLCVELDKNYKETRLQLYVDPINLFFMDSVKRKYDKNLKQGHLCLSSVQLRGHAMFSDYNRLKTDTLEYAWLMEILLGNVNGYITPVQTEQLVKFVETFVNLLIEKDYSLKPVYLDRLDPGLPFKYDVLRFSIDTVDVYLVECGTALNVQLYPIRLSICNSHTNEYEKGLSVFISKIQLKQYLNEANRSTLDTVTNTTSCSDSQASKTKNKPKWRQDGVDGDGDGDADDDNDASSSVTISSLGSSVYSLFNADANNKSNGTIKKGLSFRNKSGPDLKQAKSTTDLNDLRLLDSNDFNFWFECASASFGPIMLDMTLDKGKPNEQIEFLRLHDKATKRLYFLWDQYYDYVTNEHKSRSETLETGKSLKCGCIGGCYFYGVGKEDFLDTTKPLTRCEDYGKSVFKPDTFILHSQEIMLNKYEIKMYDFQMDDGKLHASMQSLAKQQRAQSIRSLKSLKQFERLRSVKSKTSKSSKSTSNLNDDYYTATEDEDEENGSSSDKRTSTLKPSTANSGSRTRFSVDTNNSTSVSSFNSAVNADETLRNGDGDNEDLDDYLKYKSRQNKMRRPSKLDLTFNNNNSQQNFEESVSESGSVIINDLDNENDNDEETYMPHDDDDDNDDDEDMDYYQNGGCDVEGDACNEDETNPNGIKQNPKLTLKFDIQRPILESILPKYSYLKSLTRVCVFNWNKIYRYPYFEEFNAKKNIHFQVKSNGFNCSLLKSLNLNAASTSDANTAKQQQPPQTDDADRQSKTTQVKFKANLCLKNYVDFYVTPISLASFERYLSSMFNTTTINSNYLLTMLESRSQSYANTLTSTTAQAIEDIIKCTQISLTIPQVRFCSFQVGLAEDKKNMLIDTLVHPDELITQSLFVLCMHKIETQLVDDSTHKTAAIFKIEQIDTQFRRLHTSEQLTSMAAIKLSCIKNERSKVSFQCFNQDDSVPISACSGSIMYECAIQGISIKAIKEFNLNLKKSSLVNTSFDSTSTLTSINSDRTIIDTDAEKEKTQLENNNRLSLCEFDIRKIWFSFPEPPVSPKGKRKIPYNRYEWNLLSSISPAVTSWLCAFQHITTPLKIYHEIIAYNEVKTLAALISGSLKHKDELLSLLKIQDKNEQYLTTESATYLKDPNCRLAKLLRLYLYKYCSDIEQDLNLKSIPDLKSLKRGIEAMLTCWLPMIEPRTNDHITNKANENFKNLSTRQPPNVVFSKNNVKIAVNGDFDMMQNGNFQFISEIRCEDVQTANPSVSSKITGLRNTNETRKNPSFSSINTNNRPSSMESLNNLHKQDTLINFSIQTGKTQSSLSNIVLNLNGNGNGGGASSSSGNDANEDVKQKNRKQSNANNNTKNKIGDLHAHVGPILRQSNKYFKPFLNFIGSDAPNGTLVDNIFKQFGSTIIGYLNIKSVDINILTNTNTTGGGVSTTPSFARDLPSNIKFRKQSRFSRQLSTNVSSDKTTILSFDDLLVNINVRQVLPDDKLDKRRSTAVNGFFIKHTKYYTKIDTAIQLNNLTQEINMPLLRLAHQLYSIVVETSEYDKEHDSMNYMWNESSLNQSFEGAIRKVDSLRKMDDLAMGATPMAARKDKLSTSLSRPLLGFCILKGVNHQYKPSTQSISKDCWTYMLSILQLKDFVPETKYVEKNEIIKELSKRPRKSYVHRVTKTIDKDQNIVSLFGWVNINQIDSRASLGTLVFDGQMKNIQLSTIFGKKIDPVVLSDTKEQYEGNFNLRIGATTGKLTQNSNRNTIVEVSIGKSHTFTKIVELSPRNLLKSYIHIGMITIDVPLRPIDIHSVVYRESKVIEQKIIPEFKNFVIFEETLNEAQTQNFNQTFNQISSQIQRRTPSCNSLNRKTSNKFDVTIKARLDGCDIKAKLLERPCLKASYILNNIEIFTVITDKSSLRCTLRSHCLSFQYDDLQTTTTTTATTPQSHHQHGGFTHQSLSHSLSYQNKLASESSSGNKPGQQKPTQQSSKDNTTKIANFDLPGIVIDGLYIPKQIEDPVNKQQRNIVDVQLMIKISDLTRELDSTVIAQLVFVIQVFIQEINNILQAVYYTQAQESAKPPPPPTAATQTVSKTKTEKTRLFYNINVQAGKISLTAVTPTFTALSVYTGEENRLYLTNSQTTITLPKAHAQQQQQHTNKYLANEYTLKPFIDAKFHINVDLKTCFTKHLNEDLTKNLHRIKVNNDWYQLASFNTKIHLKNSVYVSNIKECERESIIITVEKPRFYLQPGAVDNSILFWLNYKSTYDYWVEKREIYSSNKMTNATTTAPHRPSVIPPQNEPSKMSNLLTLKLRVNNFGLALPLSNKMTKDFKTNTDCLVITLNETTINACSSGCVVSNGKFNNFCLRFLENFNLDTSNWLPDYNQAQQAHQNAKPLMNSWLVPAGSYEACSSTSQNLTEDYRKKISRPLWILSVKWEMKGIDVNLDTSIGKWFSKLGGTVTRLAETQYMNEDSSNDQMKMHRDAEIRRLKNSLQYYKDCGDILKVNQLQANLDRLTLASYPQKAKKILVKTRNNLKGQFGFNTNQQSPAQQQQPQTPISTASYPQQISAELASTLLPAEKEAIEALAAATTTTTTSTAHHTRSRSGDNIYKRGHSFSNEDTVLNSISESKAHLASGQNTPSTTNLAFSGIGTNSYTIEEDDYEGTNDSPSNPSYPKIYPKTPTASQLNTNGSNATAATTAVDFKLDVRITIHSGKCILHASPAQPKVDDTDPYAHYQQQPNALQKLPNTNIIFPGVDVKAFYESTHHEINKRLAKKANLYANVKLDSFMSPAAFFQTNRDMCISPAVLDFLEQALEPFNESKNRSRAQSNFTEANQDTNHARAPSTPQHPQATSTDATNTDTEGDSNTATPTKAGQNDGHQHDVPNTVSNMVNTNSEQAIQQNYFPVDVIVVVSMLPSSIRFTCAPHTHMECLLRLPLTKMVFSTKSLSTLNQLSTMHHTNSADVSDMFTKVNQIENGVQVNNGGGLSVTCCMTDFSLKFYNSLAGKTTNENRYQSNSLHNADSLSVHVGHIKVNISRTRRLISSQHSITANELTANGEADMFNDVKLSVLADIGYTSFTYSMINMKDFFVFPKYWYRRTLARRLFLGEETSVQHPTATTTANDGFSEPQSPLFFTNGPFNQIPHKSDKFDKLRKSASPASVDSNQSGAGGAAESDKHILQHGETIHWQTLVLVSIKLEALEIRMNVGSVLGNVSWFTRKARSSAKVSISSFGPRRMQFNFILDSSKIIAENGLNLFTIRTQDISSFVEIDDEDKVNRTPKHKIDFNIYAIECRMEMSYSPTVPILTCRLSNFNVKLHDLWPKMIETATDMEDKMKRILLELDASWDQFHLMITRSTTPELISLYYTLTNHFKKQFTEGKHYIKDYDLDIFYEVKIKQQAMEQKEVLVKKHFNMPGGTILIKGNNFTIVTFEGNNFKSNRWALFSLNEPSLTFSTDIIINPDNKASNSQSLQFALGHNDEKRPRAKMASIYMANHESTSLVQLHTINDWFEYAHHRIEAVGLRDFPTFNNDYDYGSEPNKKLKLNERIRWDDLFHLPSLEVNFNSTIKENIVTYSFKTDFHDHIIATLLTSYLSTLYELIKSYVKERESQEGKDYIPLPTVDERVYNCVWWELEPKLKFTGMIGSSTVEPYGVDKLLWYLGLSHAKLTVPKWIQRGVMDSSNDLVQKIIKAYIKILPDIA